MSDSLESQRAERSASMKITDVESTVLGSPAYLNGGWLLVRVTTDDGIEGIGECFVPDRDGKAVFAARELIDRSLKRAVIGQDVLDIRKIWEDVYEICRGIYDRRGMAIHSLSGLDMAVHDAAGKTLGVPVHKLLGGQFRDRVRLYISSIWVNPSQLRLALDATEHYVGQGFTAIKYFGWPEFGEDLERDAAVLRDLRAAAGKGTELMLDLGRPPSLTAAIKCARMVERSGADIGWWEEPLSTSDDLDNLAHLTARTDLTIAAGEGELTAFQFKELLARRAVDLLQPDLSWVGGITEGKRISEMARLFNTPMIPHNWGTIVNFAASIQLVASMPQGFLCEYPITNRLFDPRDPLTASPMMTEIAGSGITIEDGYAIVPQTPGLGIELDEDAVGKHMRVT